MRIMENKRNKNTWVLSLCIKETISCMKSQNPCCISFSISSRSVNAETKINKKMELNSLDHRFLRGDQTIRSRIRFSCLYLIKLYVKHAVGEIIFFIFFRVYMCVCMYLNKPLEFSETSSWLLQQL